MLFHVSNMTWEISTNPALTLPIQTIYLGKGLVSVDSVTGAEKALFMGGKTLGYAPNTMIIEYDTMTEQWTITDDTLVAPCKGQLFAIPF